MVEITNTRQEEINSNNTHAQGAREHKDCVKKPVSYTHLCLHTKILT